MQKNRKTVCAYVSKNCASFGTKNLIWPLLERGWVYIYIHYINMFLHTTYINISFPLIDSNVLFQHKLGVMLNPTKALQDNENNQII